MKADLILRRSIRAKLVQSVKEKSLSSYLSKIFQPLSQSTEVMGSMARKALVLMASPNLTVALLPMVLERRLKVSTRTRLDVRRLLL